MKTLLLIMMFLFYGASSHASAKNSLECKYETTYGGPIVLSRSKGNLDVGSMGRNYERIKVEDDFVDVDSLLIIERSDDKIIFRAIDYKEGALEPFTAHAEFAADTYPVFAAGLQNSKGGAVALKIFCSPSE